jgi:hypothetical protein
MQTMYPYPVPSSRGAFRRRSQGEERERHLRAGETQPPTPGGTRAASPATMSRPGPTTVKGIKAKMPRWRAARRGCTAVHHGPAAAGHRLVASQAQRLVGAPTPSIGAKRIDRNEGAPWPKAHEQGTISHVLLPRPRVALFEQNPLCGGASIMVLIAAPFPSYPIPMRGHCSETS